MRNIPFFSGSGALNAVSVCLATPVPLHRARPHPRPLGTDLRAAARGLGANVIKIDALPEDAAGEQPAGPRQGSDFQNLHRNKRAMMLNLKDPKGLGDQPSWFETSFRFGSRL